MPHFPSIGFVITFCVLGTLVSQLRQAQARQQVLLEEAHDKLDDYRTQALQLCKILKSNSSYSPKNQRLYETHVRDIAEILDYYRPVNDRISGILRNTLVQEGLGPAMLSTDTSMVFARLAQTRRYLIVLGQTLDSMDTRQTLYRREAPKPVAIVHNFPRRYAVGDTITGSFHLFLPARTNQFNVSVNVDGQAHKDIKLPLHADQKVRRLEMTLHSSLTSADNAYKAYFSTPCCDD